MVPQPSFYKKGELMLLHEILGIKYPIIQGAMAHIATPEFAATVSNTGALGIVATGTMDAERAEQAILKCKSLTDKPFGVNLMLMNPHCDAIVEIIIKHKPVIVTTGAGNPGPYIPRLKAAGIKVVPIVPTVSLARRLESVGADMIIVEGTESGGHVGEMTTLTLVPQAVDALKIPVIAAGGIADGRTMAAVLNLGAIGVQVGTVLLTAHECPCHDNYKQAVLNAKDSDTVVTGRSVGAPVRILKNKMSTEYIKREKMGTTRDELEHLTLGSLRRAVFEGDMDTGSLMMGQIAGMMKTLRPIQQIFDDMIRETKDQAKRFKEIDDAL
jgi:enoyl-[acyl-carrier protein] reductase II